jgi:hypothetical protein
LRIVKADFSLAVFQVVEQLLVVTLTEHMDTNPNIIKKESGETESPQKHAGTAAVLIAGCAFLSFMLASLWGAAWAGAVVACALSVMGMVVAGLIMRRA